MKKMYKNVQKSYICISFANVVRAIPILFYTDNHCHNPQEDF